jgi:GDP-L-fucose synthase
MKRSDTILVTGANGLAGSAVVEHLRANHFTCVVPLTRDDVDLRNHGLTAAMFRRIQPAHVFHAAATVYGLGGNMANQGKAFLDNTLINTAVIDAAKKCGSVKKITVMGTNCVYPYPPELPYRESTIFDGRPDVGEVGYAHAKRHMLAMLEVYHQSYGLDYCYIVSGNLYGPRDKFNPETGHVLPSLIRKFWDAKQNPDDVVSVWGNGTATRDFLYSADLARIVHILMSEAIKPGAINIGHGKSYSIRQAVLALSVISGVSMDRVQWDATKPNGRPECYADLSRIRALGFLPSHDLVTGLKATWDWFSKDHD